jgi:hypothetical protein
MIRTLLGSFIAAVLLFGFGAAFWNCPTPYAYVEKPSQGSDALGKALREHLPNDGLYLVPGKAATPEETLNLYRRGPVATIHYRKDGVEPMSPELLVTGFFHGWVTTLLLAITLRLCALPRFGQRLLVVTLTGLAVVNYSKLGDGIYWFQPWPWLLLNAAYDAVAFLLVAAILGAIVKPARIQAAPSPVA